MPVTADQLYEQTLVLRSQMGDESAFAGLLELYGPRLLRFVQQLSPASTAPAVDLAQEVWILAFRALPRLLDAGKFRPWLFRIARDRVYREYRRRQLEAVSLDDELDAAELKSDDTVSAVDVDVDVEELQHCLDGIPAPQREALLLRFFEELSYEEIAAITHTSVGTVRSRIHYGKRTLRQIWEERSARLSARTSISTP